MSDIDLDGRLRLLSDRTRRSLLRYLRRRQGETQTVDDIVDYLIATDAVASDRDDRRRELRQTLHHSHLPKLSDGGFLEYDRASGEIRYRSDERMEAALDALQQPEISAIQ